MKYTILYSGAILIAITFSQGCSSKEERLLQMEQNKEERLLKMKQEHELRMEKLRMKNNQSSGEKVLDGLLDTIPNILK
ncbi:hypothetical protein [Helicobacter mesocricetorum]|uniref:hypothetical protein n=1 Tax=Helicobacter mesocricetorum TaxID=87012 RepID=UPI000CF04F2C|nr:hypothetical protein [Helicobacter mesocricetorum]